MVSTNKYSNIVILRHNLKAIEDKLNIKNDVVFHQDNDQNHTAQLMKEWLILSSHKVLKKTGIYVGVDLWKKHKISNKGDFFF